MSLKSQTLRDLVVERLVVAANEIFELFERTFAEYEEEFLRSQSPQKPREEPRQRDEPGLESVAASSEVKYEDKETPLESPFTFFKSEENLDKSFFRPQQDAAPEHLYGADEPSCSLVSDGNHFEPYCRSDTDNSEDWEPSSARKSKSNRPSLDHDSHGDIFSGDFQNAESRPCRWSEGEAFLRTQEYDPLPAYGNEELPRDKPFSCPVCAKTFPQKRNLKSHMRVHTGERPYHCVPCGLSFKFQQNFCQHDLTVHRKDKPFRCRVCKKDFGDKAEMIAHRNSHDSSFTCSTCGKVFNCKKYLRRHAERCPRNKRSSRNFKT